MSSTLLTNHYYCMSCEEVIPDTSLCSKHYFECNSPHILRIRLVAHPKENQKNRSHSSKNNGIPRNASPSTSCTRDTAPKFSNASLSEQNPGKVQEFLPNNGSPRKATPYTCKAQNDSRRNGKTYVYGNKEVINNNYWKQKQHEFTPK
ncbi:hypothetical protein EV44_g3183 [Erysiphe necator]|uniref:Uncharacterized protein n=1 Tax=Uncinula necator TaxID=52586 RepID=A0A0B1NYM9_UNCNE|nr:hypothetical protein EV44_g3183 [Erysiphe necator]